MSSGVVENVEDDEEEDDDIDETLTERLIGTVKIREAIKGCLIMGGGGGAS